MIKKISVIIPCHNEIHTLKEIITRIQNVDPKSLFEIIVVDDFSDDGSRDLLQKDFSLKISKLILNNKNYGKGFSVKKGIESASGEIIIIQDADLEYDPKDYNKLIKPIIDNRASAVYGSRFISSDERKIHFFWHTLANKILTLFCNIRTNLNLTDMECGLKAFEANAIKSIKIEEKKFGFEPEVTIKLAQKKFSFYEIGVSYYGRSYLEGKKIGIKDAIAAFYIIFFKYYV
jgi:glycosyltransferase involved in cell wall biosynthesis